MKEKLNWSKSLLDALDFRVQQTGQGTDYSDRINESRERLNLQMQALDLATSQSKSKNPAPTTHFQDMIKGQGSHDKNKSFASQVKTNPPSAEIKR